MTTGETPTGRVGAREERGQALVEYALILALVSLAAIVALGFLSGKINELFSKAGNTLNTVEVSSGGSGGGGSSFVPPVNNTVSVGDPTAVWFSGGLFAFNGAGVAPVPAVFSTTAQGHSPGSTQSMQFPVPSSGVYQCVWKAAPGNNGYWSTNSGGGGQNYDYYCN